MQELELSKDGKGYRTVMRCPIHFVLTHDNKGFEGLHLHEHQGHRYMMGLCEGELACCGMHQVLVACAEPMVLPVFTLHNTTSAVTLRPPRPTLMLARWCVHTLHLERTCCTVLHCMTIKARQ